MEPASGIQTPPKGLAILAMIGPGMIWCSDMIGSGEVILTTRNGAIFGIGIMWAVVVGMFLKYWIGVSGARYTVCTGEGMMDMLDRIPGPKHWVVWIVLFIQFLCGCIATSALASASGVFINALIPVSPYFGGWAVCIISFILVWFGGFKIFKIIMSFFVFLIIVGVFYVAVKVFPPFSDLLKGFLFRIPPVPDWAVTKANVHVNPWREVLPLMGWVAGGFASQVWYTYWVIGGEYGMTRGRGYGRPADVKSLKTMDVSTAKKIKGWLKVVYSDAAVAMGITLIVTLSFLVAGAGILGPRQLAPQGPQVALTLSKLFSTQWGSIGAVLFLVSGASALIGTLMVQLSGWPRLLSDACRILFPSFGRLKWKIQFRIFLVFLFCTNVLVVYTLGYNPVRLVKIGAVSDGLLLTPFQAIWIAVGLHFVLPKLTNKEAYKILKPHWTLYLFLILAFVVFGFCVLQISF